MRGMQWTGLALLSAVMIAGPMGCTKSSPPADGGSTEEDSGVADSGPVDAGTVDAGHDAGTVVPHDGGNTFFDAGMMVPIVPAMTDAGTISVVSQQEVPAQIVVGGSNVYWLTLPQDQALTGADNIVTAPIAGGTPTTLASPPNTPLAIAVDATNLYWVEEGSYTNPGTQNETYNNDGAVVKMALSGGTTTTIASGQLQPNTIAIDSNNVYWTNQGPLPTTASPIANQGTVMSVPIAGGTPSTLYSAQLDPTAIAVGPLGVYWAVYGSLNTGGTAYQNNGAVLSGSLTGGGTPVTIASRQQTPGAVAVDSTNIYWATPGTFSISNFNAGTGTPVSNSGIVAYAPIAGGATVTVSTTEDWPTTLGSDGVFMYWVNTGTGMNDGSLNGVPLAGGPNQNYVYHGINSWGLAVDSSAATPAVAHRLVDAGPEDAGSTDAGATTDAGTSTDAGSSTVDAGPDGGYTGPPPATTILFWTDEGTVPTNGSVDEFVPAQ